MRSIAFAAPEEAEEMELEEQAAAAPAGQIRLRIIPPQQQQEPIAPPAAARPAPGGPVRF